MTLRIPVVWVRLIVLVVDLLATAIIPRVFSHPFQTMVAADTDGLREMMITSFETSVQICIYSFVIGIVLAIAYGIFIQLPVDERTQIFVDVRMGNQIHLLYIITNFLKLLIQEEYPYLDNIRVELIDMLFTGVFITSKPTIFSVFEAAQSAAGVKTG